MPDHESTDVEGAARSARRAGNMGDALALPSPKRSGTLSLRIPPDLHSELAAEAEREGMSLNSYILLLIRQVLR